MHGEVISGNGSAPAGGHQCGPAGLQDLSRRLYWHRRQRQTRRWCALGFVLIPVVLALLWMQYAAARQGSGRLLVADEFCGCRDQVANWVSDYVWTQMIWLPGNVLAVLVWCALAFKLWGGKRR